MNQDAIQLLTYATANASTASVRAARRAGCGRRGQPSAPHSGLTADFALKVDGAC